jgi:uncharacterized protein (TIGR02270 family)
MIRPVVQPIIDQHAGDAVVMYQARTQLASAPHANLRHLHRFDTRLAAHLDGLLEAGPAGKRSSEAALENPSLAALFIATVHAINGRDRPFLEHLFGLAQALPAVRSGMFSGFGWVSFGQIRDLLPVLLDAAQPLHRLTSIAAYGMHRVVDESPLLTRRLDADVSVVARTVRWSGEVGAPRYAREYRPISSFNDEECTFWGVWADVLRQGRGDAVTALSRFALEGPHSQRALQLALQASNVHEAGRLLKAFPGEPRHQLWRIQSVGVVGMTDHIPWLISLMRDDTTARRAGEAFSLITRADLALMDLERRPPEYLELGPNDDPDDPNVDTDHDDGLPWPDTKKVEEWWAKNSSRFQKGTRYFMGQPVTREHCIDVLKTGYQRQRILAAHYLCLLEPGTPLFNTSAPAWRQQRLLATM